MFVLTQAFQKQEQSETLTSQKQLQELTQTQSSKEEVTFQIPLKSAHTVVQDISTKTTDQLAVSGEKIEQAKADVTKTVCEMKTAIPQNVGLTTGVHKFVI